MSNIFIHKNGERAGPFSVEQVNDQLQSGEISATYKGWMQGMEGWEALSCESLKAAGVTIPPVEDDEPPSIPDEPPAMEPAPPALEPEPEPAPPAPEPEPEPAPPTPEPEPEPAPPAPEPEPTPAPTPKPAAAAPKPAAAAPKPAAAAPKPAAAAPKPAAENVGGGFNLIRCVQDAIAIFKENIVPCVVVPLCMPIPILRETVIVNFMASVKAAKAEGKAIGIGDLFKFDRIVGKFLGVLLCEIAIGIGSILLFVPGLVAMGVLAFTPCVLADKPDIPFMNAFKGVLSYGKENILQQCVLASVIFGFNMAGFMLLGLGVFASLPVTLTIVYLAYEANKEAVASHLAAQEAS